MLSRNQLLDFKHSFAIPFKTVGSIAKQDCMKHYQSMRLKHESIRNISELSEEDIQLMATEVLGRTLTGKELELAMDDINYQLDKCFYRVCGDVLADFPTIDEEVDDEDEDYL